MRVISGTAKRIPLVTPEGLDTRPTTDRTKETLFNMIQPYLADCRFLDLFSGSGAIGIEALSRGAQEAVFVENGKEALQCINKNLEKTRLSSNAVVMRENVFDALNKLEGSNKVFDVVFMDPPYNKELERQVLEKLDGSNIVNEETVIIVEASLDTDFGYIEQTGFEIKQEKKYKTNKHVFLLAKKQTDWEF